MSKHGSAALALAGTVLAGTVLAGMGLAGCSGSVPKGATPQVTSNRAGTPGATAATSGTGTQASSASPGGSSPGSSGPGASSPGGSAGQSAGAGTGSATDGGARQAIASKSFAKANSIPFPVAVGNTWVYQTTAGSATGRTTNRIVAAGPGSAGYQVTMSSATSVAGVSAAVSPVYTFYPDGTVGYPAPAVNGVSVTGGGIRWPNASALASGQAYHSTLRIQVGASGTDENAGVNVYGAGTETVTVPAGTYKASVVVMTIAAKGETIVVTTWIAQGVGTVKTQVQISGAGAAGLTSTQELLSFAKSTSVIGDGS
jgi:hypothetical protein